MRKSTKKYIIILLGLTIISFIMLIFLREYKNIFSYFFSVFMVSSLMLSISSIVILNGIYKRKNYLTLNKMNGHYCKKCSYIFLNISKTSTCPICKEDEVIDKLPFGKNNIKTADGFQEIDHKFKKTIKEDDFLTVKFYSGDNFSSIPSVINKNKSQILHTNLPYFIFKIYGVLGFEPLYFYRYNKSAVHKGVYGLQKRTTYYTREYMKVYFSIPSKINNEDVKDLSRYLSTFNPYHYYETHLNRKEARDIIVDRFEKLNSAP